MRIGKRTAQEGANYGRESYETNQTAMDESASVVWKDDRRGIFIISGA